MGADCISVQQTQSLLGSPSCVELDDFVSGKQIFYCKTSRNKACKGFLHVSVKKHEHNQAAGETTNGKALI